MFACVFLLNGKSFKKQLLDIAKIEDEVGNEHPGTAGDQLNDGGARGTGKGGRQASRSGEQAPASNNPPASNTAPRVDPSSRPACLADKQKFVAAQTVLITKGLLTGKADGFWGRMSQAALDGWTDRNSLPRSSCLTEAMYQMLTTA